MDVAQKTVPVSPKLLKVAELARNAPETRFTSLAHLIDAAALTRAFARLRSNASAGVDGITKREYEEGLDQRVQDLHALLRSGRYRHQPIRRVYIPKEGGERPIGVSTVADKLVQGALQEILQALYEPIFHGFSFGFRPGRGAHDAMRALNGSVAGGGAKWVLESDITSFFDSIDRSKLMELLRLRISDSVLLRLIGKCLHVGVLESGDCVTPEQGTAQGSALSPMLGNIYLHYALDEWCVRELAPSLRGRVQVNRYADDFVMVFRWREDAERALMALRVQLARYGLALHEGKTRIIPFSRPPAYRPEGKGPETFDFLGFTVSWRRTRRGLWRPRLTTANKRLRRSMKSLRDYCRMHRHDEVRLQWQMLNAKLRVITTIMASTETSTPSFV